MKCIALKKTPYLFNTSMLIPSSLSGAALLYYITTDRLPLSQLYLAGEEVTPSDQLRCSKA
jgi:hypothetical protein